MERKTLWLPQHLSDEVEERSISLADPAFAEYFGVGSSDAGVQVSELTALGVSSVYRAVALIAQTIAGLPLRSYDVDDGQEAYSFIRTRPAGQLDSRTRYEWVETILLHLLLHGNAYLVRAYNRTQQLIGLLPMHPLCVIVDWERDRAGNPTGRKSFQVSDVTGRVFTLGEDSVLHIPGLTSDGLRGYSPIYVARHSFGKSIAADRAAARAYSSGWMLGGLVTTEDELEEEEAAAIKAKLDRNASGWENAARVALVNRNLKFTPWTISMADAQFLESRQFEVEEVARWFGLLPIHLAQTEKQTSWGTGVAEQNRGLARFTLMGWTSRIEQRLNQALAADGISCSFDYSGLLRPAPEQEIPLLIDLVNAGVITINEARARQGLGPIEGGDQIGTTPPAPTPAVTP